MIHIDMIFHGLLLGIGAAAPIGPVNVELVRRTLQGGFRAGVALGCGAVTVDVAYAILVSVSLRPAFSHSTIMTALGVFGAALLVYLGVGCLRLAWRDAPIDLTARASSARNYVTGILMTGPNPMTLAYWFVVVPTTVASLTADVSRDLPFVCAGVFIATLAWVVCFAGLVSRVGGLGKQRWMRIANLAGGVLLLSFAGVSIWQVARAHLLYPPLSHGN